MYPIPPCSRQQLEWYNFDQPSGEDWCLNLLPFYALLFEFQEPELMQKSSAGFRNSRSGKTKYAFFEGLDEDELKRIQSFVECYEKYVIIGINDNIRPYFSDELDCCCALDFNYEKTSDGRKRTEVGELEYNAKYHKCDEAIKELVTRLIEGLNRISRGFNADKLCLTYVPPKYGKDFDLPGILAKEIASVSGHAFSRKEGVTLVNAGIHARSVSAKNLPLDNKIKLWHIINEKDMIDLDNSVKGLDVYVIDDLYQSGVTIWSYAQYLKRRGAASVKGLVCVKTWSDRDNL